VLDEVVDIVLVLDELLVVGGDEVLVLVALEELMEEEDDALVDVLEVELDVRLLVEDDVTGDVLVLVTVVEADPDPLVVHQLVVQVGDAVLVDWVEVAAEV
jgi:hypothetical protein